MIEAEALDKAPSLVVADHQGHLFEIPELALAGREDTLLAVPAPEDLLPLPLGSDLFHLPGRLPVGIDRSTGESVTIEEYEGTKVVATGAFIAPAYTAYYHPAWEVEEDAPRLPLYAYCALGWADEAGFVVPAERVDPDVRQDHDQYDSSQIDRRGREMKLRYPKNRLASHLMNNCLLTYNCPAARNFAFERWEMPLPTAPKCNSRCFGCISQQPKKGFAISQQRLDFVPTAEEIAGIAIPHLEKAERPVASFGQGCEGEPLTNPELLEEAIRAIRAATSRGTINLNTNGSLPGAVEKLFGAGLDSIRVSINSLKPDWYTRYYAPQGYSFEDVLETLRVAARKKKFCSLNYLVFPGITDAASEVEAFLNVLRNIPVDMIQWRNLNIDPDEYLDYLEADPDEERIGIRQLLQKVRQEFPQVRFGYFNPCLTEDLVRNP